MYVSPSLLDLSGHGIELKCDRSSLSAGRFPLSRLVDAFQPLSASSHPSPRQLHHSPNIPPSPSEDISLGFPYRLPPLTRTRSGGLLTDQLLGSTPLIPSGQCRCLYCKTVAWEGSEDLAKRGQRSIFPPPFRGTYGCISLRLKTNKTTRASQVDVACVSSFISCITVGVERRAWYPGEEDG